MIILLTFQMTLLAAALAALTRAIIIGRRADRLPWPASSDLRVTSIGWSSAATILGATGTIVGAVIVICL